MKKPTNSDSLFEDPDFKSMMKKSTRWVLLFTFASLGMVTFFVMIIIWAIKHL